MSLALTREGSFDQRAVGCCVVSGGPFSFDTVRFVAWEKGAEDAPTGAPVFDTNVGDAATDGVASWDDTTQTARWQLPTNGLGDSTSLLWLFFLSGDSPSMTLPTPSDSSGHMVYGTLRVVSAGELA